jgi:hypothetical protein
VLIAPHEAVSEPGLAMVVPDEELRTAGPEDAVDLLHDLRGQRVDILEPGDDVHHVPQEAHVPVVDRHSAREDAAQWIEALGLRRFGAGLPHRRPVASREFGNAQGLVGTADQVARRRDLDPARLECGDADARDEPKPSSEEHRFANGCPDLLCDGRRLDEVRAGNDDLKRGAAIARQVV